MTRWRHNVYRPMADWAPARANDPVAYTPVPTWLRMRDTAGNVRRAERANTVLDDVC